ncbi:hypothetical protein ACFSTC_39260 [Nonomuraea ferruginea]
MEVAGVVASMPTSAPGQQAVLADWETLQARELAAAQPPRPVTEWWLAASDTAPARAILRENPQWDVTVADRGSWPRSCGTTRWPAGCAGRWSSGSARRWGSRCSGSW